MKREIDNIEIVKIRGHYEAFVDGNFVLSADTWEEILSDLTKEGYL